MKSIHRYMFKQVAYATFFVTLVVTMAVWLTQSLRFIDYIVNRGLPLTSFLMVVGLMLPAFITVVLPFTLFVSVLFVYNKFITDSELVVLRAAGFSQLSLSRPALVLALLITGIGYGLTLYLMPAAYNEFKEWQLRIRSDYTTVILQEGVFNKVMDGMTVYVRERGAEGELLGIFIHDSRDSDTPTTYMADRGALVTTAKGPHLVMANGNRQWIDGDSGQMALLEFESLTVDISGEDKEEGGLRWRGSKERFLDELFFPKDEGLSDKIVNMLRAEAHQRLVGPLYSIAFTLVALAALLSGSFSRRGQLKRILAAAGVFVIFQALAIWLQNVAGKVPDLIPLMYVNVVLPSIASLWVMMRSPTRRKRPHRGALATEGTAAT